MMKYITLSVKILIIMICLPFIGDFIINEVLDLNIDWAYSIFLVLSALLVTDIIGSTFCGIIYGDEQEMHVVKSQLSFFS